MELEHSEVTEQIIGAAIEVHRELGPGLLESAYRACMVHELALRGLDVATEVPIPLEYKGLHLTTCYRLDVVVEGAVVLELKAIKTLERVHHAQLLSYLRLSGLHVGLLINFHVPVLREGLRRIVR
ncbi:MAG: GxxExxY protein [Myxococcales bacterium]|nr:GxxExxY protein [Myxococcales bacterium]MCB9731239.1 GxxExxY protein [Deltaproteobacteria bacterium]